MPPQAKEITIPEHNSKNCDKLSDQLAGARPVGELVAEEAQRIFEMLLDDKGTFEEQWLEMNEEQFLEPEENTALLFFYVEVGSSGMGGNLSRQPTSTNFLVHGEPVMGRSGKKAKNLTLHRRNKRKTKRGDNIPKKKAA